MLWAVMAVWNGVCAPLAGDEDDFLQDMEKHKQNSMGDNERM